MIRGSSRWALGGESAGQVGPTVRIVNPTAAEGRGADGAAAACAWFIAARKKAAWALRALGRSNPCWVGVKDIPGRIALMRTWLTHTVEKWLMRR
jgi:hypothetical protein